MLIAAVSVGESMPPLSGCTPTFWGAWAGQAAARLPPSFPPVIPPQAPLLASTEASSEEQCFFIDLSQPVLVRGKLSVPFTDDHVKPTRGIWL